MSKRVLNYTVRTEKKKKAYLVREAGNVPAVVYGKSSSTPITVNEKEFLALFESTVLQNYIITLKGSEGEKKVLVKESVLDYLAGIVVHIDFFEFNEAKKVTCPVPIKLEGTPVGVLSGGLLEVKRNNISIRSLPNDIPEFLPLDISKMDMGDSIRVRDLAVDEKIDIQTPGDIALVAISIPRSARGKAKAS